MKSLEILPIGTVRLKRLKGYQPKINKSLKSEGRESYDYQNDISNNIAEVTWFDNRPITMLCAFSGVQSNHPYVDGHKRKKNVSQLLHKRTLLTWGKLISMACSCHYVEPKCGYFQILFHFQDVCIVNAWLLYRKEGKLKKIANFKELLMFR